MALFLITFLTIWGAIHTYVFWHLSSIPWVAHHVPSKILLIAAVLLWSSYALARTLDAKGFYLVSGPLEYFAANWVGFIFLLMCAFLVTDLLTLGGNVLASHLGTVRSGAVMVAVALALVAVIQAFRPPVVQDYEIQLAGLPAERDGLVLVQVSDLHLGTLLGRRWLANLHHRVQRLKPDVIVFVGDVVDGNVARVEPLRPILASFQAPLGVWAVTGNHEYYAGLERSVGLLEAVGFRVLRDRHQEVVPGLVLAGVDDLTARQQFGRQDYPVDRALADRPPGATVLLSHSPWQWKEAAAAGVDLMLSGHTHNGQIWPFSYLVSLRYPFIVGRYRVGDMSLIVCRGTGTWGPRMRLWRPSEIVRITLRTAHQKTNTATSLARDGARN